VLAKCRTVQIGLIAVFDSSIVRSKNREVISPRGGIMFDILSDRIKYDEHLQISSGERVVYWVAVAIVSIVSFGGLYFGIHLLQ